jgi:predicted regulator of Ras-like GTPase activity (Roadblock/LC7/MglB family)
MLSYLKKLFSKQPASAAAQSATPVRAPRVVAASPRAVATPSAKPQLAVAQLSLAAILAKFPDDLCGNIAASPDPTATVALPLATIHKQLANGAVKMSLASLYRQAPPGTFHDTKSEEKRMVEVPLSEVMRHVNVQGLRRRQDQRRVELPKGAPQLFGDRNNPYAVAPSFSDEEEEVAAPEAPAAEAHAEAEDEELAMPVFRMAPRTAPPTSTFTPPAVAPSASQPPATPALNGKNGKSSKNGHSPAVEASGTILLRLADLCEGWQEPIRSEALGLGGVEVALPAAAVAPMMSKGKVAFTWGQIRCFLTEPTGNGTQGDENTELSLPLKVVAPAFMAHSKPTRRAKAIEFDDSIPPLFGGAAKTGGEAAPAKEAPAAPEAEAAPAPAEEALAPAPAIPAKGLKFSWAEQPAAERPATEAPAPAHPSVVLAPVEAHSLGEVFGQAGRTQWSVQEIIEQTAKLPGVAGAVLALQEGLPVAASLPEEIKGDTVAAFLPQIFARLNNYTGEMNLAPVEEVLLTTDGAHFQAYRLGQLYFAVLGQRGGALPWDSLRLVVDELVKQSRA